MKHLQSLKRKRSVGLDDLPSWLLEDCMEVIASPLTYIINMSFETLTFSSDWKLTKVLPLFKSRAKSSVNNYRPISVIPAISKVIEKVVHEQLTTYLESKNFIKNNQFGSRPHHSTELAATIFIDTVKLKVNDGKMVGAVFLDLTKAFDPLSHDEHEWFTNYLFGRFQQVQYNLMNIQSIAEYHKVKHCEVVKHADDTVLFVAGKDLEIIETCLSSDMNYVLAWCLENELILNLGAGKIESMLFGSKNYSYQTVRVTSTYKYLGVLIEPSLNLSSNFDLTHQKASGRLHLLYRIRPLITEKAALAIFQTMIQPTSNFNYWKSILDTTLRILRHNYSNSNLYIDEQL
ncbi:uncharacterized protein LOC130648610 [Hydractinia symbiolongicarpus]|uniref:uncharacterized protein LOC130648610 n=1 Tax=Hydractinia symbiolongicarpus TaxID=13093 RepID=UPI00254E68BC|nr:uncharacterized protein LOC130648610 [Hydractinia symbiolongicarpus]